MHQWWMGTLRKEGVKRHGQCTHNRKNQQTGGKEKIRQSHQIPQFQGRGSSVSGSESAQRNQGRG